MALAFGNPRPFASEASALPHTVYNTALENHLRTAWGPVRRTAQPRPTIAAGPRNRRRRPSLNARWSTRRAHIETRRGELAPTSNSHGRPPTPVESLKLAQQATLETRDAKHEPRTLTEQRRDLAEPRPKPVLGGPQAVRHGPHRTAPRPAETTRSTPGGSRARPAGRVLAAMEERRSTWQIWHVRAEAQRQVRSSNSKPTE